MIMTFQIPDKIDIPDHALDELLNIMKMETGQESLKFDRDDLHDLGSFLLVLTALSFEQKNSTCDQSY